MTQVLAYFTKVPITDEMRSKMKSKPVTFIVVGFSSLSSMYNELKGNQLALPTEEIFIQDCLNKAKDTENELDLSYIAADGLVIQMRAILLFENVPKGRHVIEIVSAINFVACENHLIYGANIKYTPSIFDVVSSPHEVINPETFNWNIPALLSTLRNVLGLLRFLDFAGNGQLYPDVITEIQTQTPELMV